MLYKYSMVKTILLFLLLILSSLCFTQARLGEYTAMASEHYYLSDTITPFTGVNGTLGYELIDTSMITVSIILTNEELIVTVNHQELTTPVSYRGVSDNDEYFIYDSPKTTIFIQREYEHIIFFSGILDSNSIHEIYKNMLLFYPVVNRTLYGREIEEELRKAIIDTFDNNGKKRKKKRN